MHVNSVGIFSTIHSALEILISCTIVEDPFALFSVDRLLRQSLYPNRLFNQIESFDAKVSINVQGIIDIRARRDF